MRAKETYVIALLIGLFFQAQAQPRYGIRHEYLCWSAPGDVDSNVIRYTMAATQTTAVSILYYTDMDGATISVSGGSLRYGPCSCASNVFSAPATPAPTIPPLTSQVAILMPAWRRPQKKRRRK